jgi:DNA-directed RNA polymerase specialized sigma24 family protein
MKPISKVTPMPRSTQTMLVHADLVRSITATLRRRGIPRQDLEDAVADVQVRTLEFLRTHAAPAGILEWKKLCNKIAALLAIDALRKKKRHAKYDVDLCEDPDAYAADAHAEKFWDPVDEARLMDVLAAQMNAAKIPAVAFVILDAEAAGTTHAEVAEELGISASAVGKRLRAMRTAFRRHVAGSGLSSLTPLRARDVRARNGTRGR